MCSEICKITSIFDLIELPFNHTKNTFYASYPLATFYRFRVAAIAKTPLSYYSYATGVQIQNSSAIV